MTAVARLVAVATFALALSGGAHRASAVTIAEFETWPQAERDDYMVALVYGLYDVFAAYDRNDLYVCLRALVGTPHGGAFDPASIGMLRVRDDLEAARSIESDEHHVDELVRGSLWRMLKGSCA